MLRITEHNENKTTTRLCLDGTIDLESYGELEGIWSQPDKPESTIVVLDMTGVVYMSDEAARKLTSWRSDSFHIVNCSPYIEMLLSNFSNEKGN